MLDALTLATVALIAQDKPAERGIRIVLITLDTLRYDRFAGTSEFPTRMPQTKAFAAHGMEFDRFYAASSSTQPTHATLFTGMHPWEHGVVRNGLVLADSMDTLAETLKAAGFSTAAAVASFPVSHGFGFAQGFDTFDDAFVEKTLADQWNEMIIPGGHFFSFAEHVAKLALEQLAKTQGTRQFFWWHFFDAHSPYGDTAGKGLREGAILTQMRNESERIPDLLAQIRDGYDSDVANLDRALASLFQQLSAEEDRFETHVVLTADHGESLGFDLSLGHGERLNDDQIHVPCFIVSPRFAAGKNPRVAGSVDLHRTLLALAGVESKRETQSPERGVAYGMRRTFSRGSFDRRIDGSDTPVDSLRFFAVHGDTIYCGNSAGIVDEVTGAALSPEEHRQGISQMFLQFERELSKTMASEIGDPAALDALRALGYIK